MSKLAIVIPVRNEVAALPHVIAGLVQTLGELDYRIIVIDDGDDNTPEVIGKMHIDTLTYVRRRVDDWQEQSSLGLHWPLTVHMSQLWMEMVSTRQE